MALDYIVVTISFVILILYMLSSLLMLSTRKRLDGKARTAFTFFIITLFLLIIRRLQQIFITSAILNPIPYSLDIITLIISITFFLVVFNFHQAIIKAHTVQKFKNFREKTRSDLRKEGHEEKPRDIPYPKNKIRMQDGYLDLTK